MVVEILAHRTGMANAPENSIAGFEHSMQYGAMGVECDITFIDRKPYVWASGTGITEPHMLCDEVLEFLARNPSMTAYFDVKYYNSHLSGHFCRISDDMIRLVYNTIIRPAISLGVSDRIGFVTFHGGIPLLCSAKKMDARIRTDLMIIFPWIRPYPYHTYVDAVTIAHGRYNHWKLFPSSLCTIIFHADALGIEVRGGLVNTLPEVKWFLDLGISSLWTDDVIRVRQQSDTLIQL